MTLNIKLTNYSYECGDGCCTDYGTIVEVNGEEMPFRNTDASTILEQVLTHLGYDVKITEENDY